MAKKALSILFFLTSLALVGCDHATKHAARTLLPRPGAIEIVPGVFDLRYAENHDTAFSLTRVLHFEEKASVLVAVAVLGIAVIAWMWWRRRTGPAFEQAGYALVVGGAVGNVLDRAFLGYVVDFMHLHHWPIFNVADVAIVVGAVMIGVSGFRQGPPAPLATLPRAMRAEPVTEDGRQKKSLGSATQSAGRITSDPLIEIASW